MIGGENKNLLVFQHGLYNFPQKDLKKINDQGKVKFYIFFYRQRDWVNIRQSYQQLSEYRN